MRIELVRESKYYCTNFEQIHDVLHQINARYIARKQQTDYIFKIFDPATNENSKRIKVRKEAVESVSSNIFIYIYNRNKGEENVIFDYYEVKDEQIISIFTSLYGEAIKIQKVREVWSIANVEFHLDAVEGIGNLFEVELFGSNGNLENEKLDEYMELFRNFLLNKIEGSNEDLIPWKG
ncbi:CYTH domain-containing protein [Paenibacillus tarimensis]